MNDPYAIERRRVRIAELAAIGSVMGAIPDEYSGPAEQELRRLCVSRAADLIRWGKAEDERLEAERVQLAEQHQ